MLSQWENGVGERGPFTPLSPPGIKIIATKREMDGGYKEGG